jgi:hypothetical protein
MQFYRCFLLLIMIIGLTGCKDALFVDCNSCAIDEPVDGEINISLTINDLNQSVPITVYNGKFEYNNIYYTDTVKTSSLVVIYPVNQYFSVTAKYKSGTKTIIAVSGGELKTKKNSGSCQNDCWTISNGDIDVKLRY